MRTLGWVSRRRKGAPSSGWSRSEGWEVGRSTCTRAWRTKPRLPFGACVAYMATSQCLSLLPSMTRGPNAAPVSGCMFIPLAFWWWLVSESGSMVKLQSHPVSSFPHQANWFKYSVELWNWVAETLNQALWLRSHSPYLFNNYWLSAVHFV